MLVIDRIAKSIFHIPGIGRVQAITRPQGTPIEHTSIPFLISMQGTTQQMNQDLHGQDRMADMLIAGRRHADSPSTTCSKMQSITVQMAAITHSMVTKMKTMTVDIDELRDHIADFDDFFRPIRNYLYWEPHCFDIPVCWSIRSIFDTLDGIDTHDRRHQEPDCRTWTRLDTLMPQLVALMPSMIETMKSMQNIMLTMYQSQKASRTR